MSHLPTFELFYLNSLNSLHHLLYCFKIVNYDRIITFIIVNYKNRIFFLINKTAIIYSLLKFTLKKHI